VPSVLDPVVRTAGTARTDARNDPSTGSGRHGRRRDVALWLVVTAWAAAWGWARARPSGISWHFFATGADLLVNPDVPGGGLHLYAAHPELQIGPVAFGLAAVLALLPASMALVAGQVVMTAVLPLALAVLAPLLPHDRRRTRILAAALVLAPTWTVLSVRWGHLDDAVALLLLCVVVRAARTDHAVVTGLAVGLAAGAKPWAVLGIPLVLMLSRRALGAFCAVAVLTAVWGPFLLADHATLAAFHPAVGVSDSSTLSLLGYRGSVIPGWDRTAQLLLAPLGALVAVRVGAWPAALLCGIAIRLALDPQDIAYYAAGAVLAAAVFDLLATRSRIPWTTLATTVALWQPFVTDFPHRIDTSQGLALWWFQHPHQVAAVHLAWALAVVALPGWWALRRAATSGADDARARRARSSRADRGQPAGYRPPAG
jgi:hypothetical protein